MEFGLSEEQTMLQDSVHRYLGDNAPLDRVRRFAEDKEARAVDVWQGLAELGVAGLIIDPDHGGVGMSVLDAALVAEVLGRHVAPVPFTATAVMVPLALALAGGETQRAERLPALAAGEQVAGIAVAELTGAREDAKVTASGGKLNGRALFAIDFEADWYLIADADHGLHLVDANASGLTRQALITVDKSRRIGELLFADVPADPLPGSSAEVITRVLDAGRIVLAADALGAAQHMLDAAVAYAAEREQFGRPIGSFQAVKHMCAEMAAGLEPCRAMVWYAGHAFDAIPEEARLSACHTKAHVAEVTRFVAKTATEVHGGMGFTDLVGLHYWFKRVGADRQLLGTPERLREEAAVLQGLAA
jgi:alkylation response protein AidB-like acyl-CoA dehydrogenase